MQAESSQLLLTTGVSTRKFSFAAPLSIRPPESVTVALPLLGDYAAVWLDGLEGLVLPSTVEAYARRLERHVFPQLAERRLDEVAVDDILALISALRRQGYAGSTIATTMTPLSRMFAHAARRGLIEINPVSKLDRNERPRVSRRERPVLGHDEIGRLLDAAPPRFRTLLATAVLSGLRQGELLGLHWRDVDFQNEVIHVRTALNRKRQDVQPKTERAVRDVILMPALAQALRQHKQESEFNQADDYVFTTRTGTPEHAAHLGVRALKPALEAADLPPIRWHDLRHTFASLLIDGGANITFVSRQLGHTSSHVTLGIYAHLLDRDEQARRTRAMLEASLGHMVRGDTNVPPLKVAFGDRR
jgi:integrase